MGNKVIELRDSKSALVKTEDRCRVVLHRPDGSEEVRQELQSFRSAMTYAQSFNAYWSPGDCWAEIQDYKTIHERADITTYRTKVKEGVQRRLTEREAEQARQNPFRRALKRAVSLLW